jgi:hypothetical protein
MSLEDPTSFLPWAGFAKRTILQLEKEIIDIKILFLRTTNEDERVRKEAKISQGILQI